jgi:hypothetical protein
MLVVELLAAWRRQRADVGEPDRTRYCCWPTDLDHSATMNHAKYLRFVNYAQRQFWMRNGVWAVCRKRSPPVRLVVAASTLRVTRPVARLSRRHAPPRAYASLHSCSREQVRCFERFAVTTRLLAWDDRAFFLQQTPRCMAAHSRPVDSGSRPLVASGHRLAACAAHAPGFRKKRRCRLAARRGALRSGHRPRPRHTQRRHCRLTQT